MTNMQIVENLYSAFSDIPRPSKIDGCRHCMSEGDINRLLGQSLRHSDPEILLNYIEDAIWTVGNKQNFKYFVPRLLELGLTDYNINNHSGNFIMFPETFGKKLAMADFDVWDQSKQIAVDDAIFAITSEEARQKDDYSFGGWMIAICYINLDKKRYLDLLDSDLGNYVRDAFLVSHRDAYKYGRMKGPFWDELDIEKTSSIYEWLVARKEESNIALGKHRRALRREREKRRY